ncbi:(2Fe-2S)-binding protein [Flagellimonas hymeniacidonis]|uniref:(2Fe-2S)-binding protein n=1 Tax=Flagellimonas hymeniacidonis TaxID=2603628 RepID=A0A5C8VAA3_9FLAO|nr:(2Fe-2S)-binding protein [Flagellimonas hymeniacidonis]TXN38303.1 (2Fe-2S)-binding protein [Flagellimonas hymeniacidonis]
MITLTINNEKYQIDASSETPLLWVLRDHLNLKGSKYSCGIAACGACKVLVDGNAVPSCVLPIASVIDAKITTIEGLGTAEELHPVQKAWIKENVPQCGYCQTGQIITAVSIYDKHDNLKKDEVLSIMNSNICRCGTYDRIKKALDGLF